MTSNLYPSFARPPPKTAYFGSFNANRLRYTFKFPICLRIEGGKFALHRQLFAQWPRIMATDVCDAFGAIDSSYRMECATRPKARAMQELLQRCARYILTFIIRMVIYLIMKQH